ncbi:hypothetical protein PBY51_015997 [Eleginops maclovinus]|uniref:Uncharacterized protein n=2 Tax=Eleginops maclovinus TaxID=56733 RepID=A0AAN7XQK6_ELEMC|nr:hypothetical protein PBY51_015997 [Eleginops maclovinus]
MNDALYNLLQSYEQYVGSCSGGEEAETATQSCTEASQLHTVPSRNKRRKTQTTKSPNTAQLQKTPHPARHAMISVDGEPEDLDTCQGRPTATLSHCVEAMPSVSPASLSAKEFSLMSTESREDDKDDVIDVISSSSPAPDPVLINWSEYFKVEEEEEDEDIDIVGNNPNYTSSSTFATVR